MLDGGTLPVPELMLSIVLTTQGSVAFAPLLTGLIEVLKSLRVPGVDGHEPQVAALLALVVVILALTQVGAAALSITGLWLGFTAWYALARLAMGIHDDLTRSRRSLTAGLAGNAVDTDPGPG